MLTSCLSLVEYVKDVYPVSLIFPIFSYFFLLSFLFCSFVGQNLHNVHFSYAFFFSFFHILLRSPRLVLLISCSSHTSVRRLENALFSITQETQSISFTKKKYINSCAQPEKGKKSQGKMRALLLLVHTDRWQDKSESFPAFSPFRFFDWLSPLYF